MNPPINAKKSETLMSFARFLHSATGRILKLMLGIGLIVWGVVMLMSGGPMWSILLVVAGAAFALFGTVNVCPVAPMFGGTFSGRKMQRDHAVTR